jgi:hypothetical protein
MAGFLRISRVSGEKVSALLRNRVLAWILVGIVFISARTAHAQWKDPRLIAGQVAFNFAVSFIGKLVHDHQSPGKAFKSALIEGTASGLVAHTGYCLTGREPQLALVGKTLAQKSSLMTRRSMEAKPVFDKTLVSHWQLTHSFVHFKFDGSPRFEIDVLNAGATAFYAFSDGYDFDLSRTLYTGSVFFRNEDNAERIRGYAVPGVVWMDADWYDDPEILGHELIHTLQFERGSAIADWRYKKLRFNFLALASGVPALLKGWGEHDNRLHEREADLYVGRR